MAALDDYLAFRRTLPPRPPLEQLTVRARGLEFAVFRTPPVANALPLCCINGGMIFDHALLWPALAPLASSRQLILYDQRGRGASSVPPGMQASRIEFDAGDVRAIREGLEIERWDVLGHSWGGGIAMLATAQDLEAVRRLVLVNSVGITSRWLPPLHAAGLARLKGGAHARLAACDPAALTRPDVAVHSEYGQAFFPAWFADARFGASVSAPVGDSATGAVVVARLRREGYDWSETLRDLPTPTIVLHGAADVLPLSEAERTAQWFARARCTPIANAGHNPFWESPAAFFDAVNAFLEEASPPS